jgi:hypothetical protein
MEFKQVVKEAASYMDFIPIPGTLIIKFSMGKDAARQTRYSAGHGTPCPYD